MTTTDTPRGKQKTGKCIDTVNKWLHENCKKGEMLFVQSSPNTLVIMKNAVFAYKVSKKITTNL